MEPLGFGARLWLALVLPFRVLFDGQLAARIDGVDDAPPALPPEPEPEPEPIEAEPETTSALQLLTLFQREGRFVDFLQEDVSGFSDADIGAAARVVHEGCTRALRDVLTLAPVRSEDEGAAVELAAGYDASRTRATGNLVGEPPFRGTLAHHGWEVTKISLPTLVEGHDPSIVAPAEVEIQ
ncbi:MAG: DUF2760 domain-containing protein [Myxococcota bacterium]